MANIGMYTEEFKIEAVKLLLTRGDRTVGDIAQSLDVAENLLHAWKRRYGNEPATARTNERTGVVNRPRKS